MHRVRGLRRVRIIIGMAVALALVAAVFGARREGAARQEERPAISLNAPAGFPVDI